MIMVGKVFILFIWTFWVIATGSVADGSDNISEYNPTYSTTYDRESKGAISFVELTMNSLVFLKK